MRAIGRGERGAALVIAILVLAILTVIGIALMLVTSTESRIAANEWSVNRAFYASDSGIRWATVQLTEPAAFLTREEFRRFLEAPPSPSGRFSSSWSHRHGGAGLFRRHGRRRYRRQDPDAEPARRRPAPGGRMNVGSERSQFFYAYEVRSASSDMAFAQYAKALVADVEVGPCRRGCLIGQP
jgi:hypothetical protein